MIEEYMAQWVMEFQDLPNVHPFESPPGAGPGTGPGAGAGAGLAGAGAGTGGAAAGAGAPPCGRVRE